jgi:Protein of unknown function (DUF3168)
MPASALSPLLSAVFTALNVPPLTTTLNCAVYDSVVPQGAPHPYAVVFSSTEVPEDTMGEYGSSLTFQVHAYTQQPGSGQATDIVSQIRQLLDQGKGRAGEPRLTVTSYETLQVSYEQTLDAGVELVNGVATQHFVVQFRAWLREAAA